jgi:hypothetical protein
MEKKKDSNWGIIIFVLALIGALGYVYYYKVVVTRVPEILTPDQMINHSDDEIKELYNKVKLTYSEEFSVTKDDLENLDEELTLKNASSNLLVYWGIRQVPNKEYGEEPVVLKSGAYTYNGRYIKAATIKTYLMRNFGINTFTNTNINTGKIRYIYNAGRDIYQLYELEEYEEPVKKIIYTKYDWDESNIYVYEYSAYTKEVDDVKTSYTKHNQLLPIGITDKNITENLDIIDEYKYTFSLNENVNKYFLSKIEYVDQTTNLTNS